MSCTGATVRQQTENMELQEKKPLEGERAFSSLDQTELTKQSAWI